MTTGLKANILGWLALTLNLHAGVSFWDGNGTAAGAGVTPTGTWGFNPYWSADPNGMLSTTAWIPGNTAVFSAGSDATGAYTVSISGIQFVGGLTFEEGSPTLLSGSILPSATPFVISVSNQATISSTLIGVRPLTKVGNGTLILDGTNDYTATTTIAEGSVIVANNSALGTTSAGTIVSNGAVLGLYGNIVLNEPLTVFSSYSIGSLQNVSGSNFVASVQMDPDRNQAGSFTSYSGVLALGRVTAGNNFQLTIYSVGDTIISGDDPSYGLFWGGQAGIISKRNNGVLLINGLVNIRGFFGVMEGTVRMGNHNRFGNAGGVYPKFSLQSPGQLDLNGFTNYIESLQGDGLVTSSVPGATLILGANTDATALGTYFPGDISGPITLIKEGLITERLRGAKTYTGETIVNGGLLDLQPCTISNSPVIRVATNGALLVNETLPGLVINSNQTLACSGSVTGSLTVASGGRIYPGQTDAVGKMSLFTASGTGGALDFSPGGTCVWRLGANSEINPGTDFDQIVMSKSSPVILGGSSRLSIEFIGAATAPTFSDPFWQAIRTWTIITSTNVLSNFAAIENGTFPAGNFTTSVATNGFLLTFTPTPCPIVITCPSNIVVECSGGFTPVTYTATAVDCASNSVPVVFTPPSGSGFRRGTSDVMCTATSPDGAATNCTFTVTVVDTTPPSITCSSNITVQATGPTGAVVTYASSAEDACGLRSFNCTPPSGSTFPVGVNTVTCTAVDNADNTNVCSFTITITPPNQCPTAAIIAVSPSLSADCTGWSNVVIAVNNLDACVVLNGSASSDADNDPLSYSWNLGGQAAITMDPAQEPGGGGTGSGVGTASLSGNTLTLNIAFSGLSAGTTAAHIYGPAGVGTNAPVLYPLNSLTTLGATSGTINGTITLVNGTGGFTIAQQLEQFFGGLWYLNIHTPLHPGGEIRGQIPAGQSGAVVTNCLPIGSHQVCLTVNDGQCADTACVTVEVISPCESAGTLIAAIEASSLPRNRRRPLIASLMAACQSFNDGRLKPGINQLGAFQNKVRAQVSDPALAQHLINCAQAIIDALEAP